MYKFFRSGDYISVIKSDLTWFGSTSGQYRDNRLFWSNRDIKLIKTAPIVVIINYHKVTNVLEYIGR